MPTHDPHKTITAKVAFVNSTQEVNLPKSWVIVELPTRYGPQVKGEKHWSSVSAVLRLSARLAVNDTITITKNLAVA